MGEADIDEEKDDEELYLISPKTGDISLALGPGAFSSTVNGTKKIVFDFTILQAFSNICNIQFRVFAIDEQLYGLKSNSMTIGSLWIIIRYITI